MPPVHVLPPPPCHHRLVEAHGPRLAAPPHAVDQYDPRLRYYIFSRFTSAGSVRPGLALAEDIISKSFHCLRGKAYLFNNVVNVTVGALEERTMLSGDHTVADIYCCCCGQNMGWKYEAAHLKSQKYKEGKFILERGRIADEVDADS